MIFHHSDGQWKRVGSTPKNIHHRPSSVSFNIDVYQIMKTVRGTLINREHFLWAGLHHVTKISKGLNGKRNG